MKNDNITMEREAVSILDCHVHIFPDEIAETALAVLSGKSGVTPSHSGTRNGLLESMAAAGIRLAVNCPVATAPRQVKRINDWAAANYRGPLLCLGSIHPDTEDAPAEIERVRSLGLLGLKLHPEYQEFTLDDPRLDACWETCSRLCFPVLIHMGEDIGFVPPYHSSPGALADLLDRFPDLIVIAAHFGGWRMWDDVDRFLIGRNLYLDTSFTLERLPPERFVDMVRRHGCHRVLFGSDSPWTDQKASVARFRSLPLSQNEQAAILWNNAVELFGIEQEQEP